MITFSTINFNKGLKFTGQTSNYANNPKINFTGNDFFERALDDEFSKSDNKGTFNKFEYQEKGNNENDFVTKGSESTLRENGYEKVSKDNNIVDMLSMAGFVGGTFLLSIGLCELFVRTGESPEDIFLPDGTYFMNTKDMSFKSANVVADGDDGIFKIKGTGIDLDKNNFDIAIPEKGIYKNLDGSADIDLLNNKFIYKGEDKAYFIDPENNISAFIDKATGHVNQLVVPKIDNQITFERHYTDSQKYNPRAYEPDYISRSDFIEKYGMPPEQYQQENGNLGYVEILPDDGRSSFDKIKDFFGLNDHSNKDYDIFGREIIKLEDNYGNVSHVALDEKLMEVVKEYNFNEADINKVANFVDNLHLKNYLLDYEPDFTNFLPNEITLDNNLHDIIGF